MRHGRAVLVAVAHDVVELLLVQVAASRRWRSWHGGGRASLGSGVVLYVDAVLLEEVLALLVVVRAVVGPVEALAEAKVGELDVAVGGEEEVVRLDVAVDVAEAVRLVDGEDHLGDVEARKVLGEDVFFDQQVEQVAATHELPADVGCESSSAKVPKGKDKESAHMMR